MVESVTASLAAGIIAVVIAVMALRRARKRRRLEAPPMESESDRLQSRKAS